MSLTVTIPDKLAQEAQKEADAKGSTVEEYVISTLAERIGRGKRKRPPIPRAEGDSPLRRLIGIAKSGPTDSSIYHDYRPGDPM